MFSSEVINSTLARGDVGVLLLVYVIGCGSQFYASFRQALRKSDAADACSGFETMRVKRVVVVAILVCFCRSRCLRDTPLSDWPYNSFAGWFERGTGLVWDYLWLALSASANIAARTWSTNDRFNVSGHLPIPDIDEVLRLLPDRACRRSTCDLLLSLRPSLKWFVYLTFGGAVLYAANRVSEYTYRYLCVHKARWLARSTRAAVHIATAAKPCDAATGAGRNERREQHATQTVNNDQKEQPRIVFLSRASWRQIFRNCFSKTAGLNDIRAAPVPKFIPYHTGNMAGEMVDNTRRL